MHNERRPCRQINRWPLTLFDEPIFNLADRLNDAASEFLSRYRNSQALTFWSIIAATEVPIYPSKDLGARTVGNCIVLFHGETVTVETVLVVYLRRDRLGGSNGRGLKAFGGKTHGQCGGDQ